MTRQMLFSTAAAAIGFLGAADTAWSQPLAQERPLRAVYHSMSIVDPATRSVMPGSYILIEGAGSRALAKGRRHSNGALRPLMTWAGSTPWLA